MAEPIRGAVDAFNTLAVTPKGDPRDQSARTEQNRPEPQSGPQPGKLQPEGVGQQIDIVA